MSSEWELLTLDKLIVNYDTRRKPVRGPDRRPGPYPYYGASGIVDYVDGYIFDGDYLLIAEDGENLRTRQTPIAFMASGKFWVNNHAHIVTGNERANTRFLQYSLQATDISGYLTGAVMPKLTQGNMNKIELKCPPLHVQEDIVGILGSLDDRITQLRETNATLEAITQTLFKSWFVDFDPVRAKAERLVPDGLDAATAALFPDSFEESELGLIPNGWRGASLADLADFQNGYAFKSKDWVATGHPVVKIGDVKPGIIDLVGCSFVNSETTRGLDRFKLERGSLLVGMTGYVGETGLVPTVNPSAYLNQRVGRFSTANGLADLGFVYCLVRNPAFKIFAEAQSHGSAQANISGAALISYPVVIPSSDVLEHFNGVIAPVLESILSNHEQAQNLAQLRDTLLPRLISGQLRLPEAEVMSEEDCA